MKKLALIIAVGLGALSFGLLSLYKGRLKDRYQGGEPTPILVALQDVSMGEILTEEMVAVREIPSSYLDGRHILAAEADKAIGVRVSMGLRANEAMLWTDLAGSGFDRRDLSSLVPSGMRALTIAVGRRSTMGGLLRPGDRIDLLLTTSEGAEAGKTLPLLQNVLVVAVGSDLGERNTKKKSLSKDITVTVNAAQAQAITHARALGALTVVLRNPDDIIVAKDIAPTTNRDIDQSLAQLQGKRDLLDLLETPKEERGREIEHVR
jgi:pilus assembly protein CpaB